MSPLRWIPRPCPRQPPSRQLSYRSHLVWLKPMQYSFRSHLVWLKPLQYSYRSHLVWLKPMQYSYRFHLVWLKPMQYSYRSHLVWLKPMQCSYRSHVVCNILSFLYWLFLNIIYYQSEHIGQWATPHHLSDVRRGAPSWI